jgi:hypothetical protein
VPAPCPQAALADPLPAPGETSRKGLFVNPSLSVILPVHNAEQLLKPRTLEMLDGLADLRASFDMLIVDDGSRDQTLELADELTTIYPQLRVVRMGCRQGLLRACLKGIRLTTGHILVLRDIQRRMGPNELQSLWALRDDPELVAAQSASDSASQRFIQQLLQTANGQSAEDSWRELPGMQLIRREAFIELCGRPAPPGIRRITRTDLAEAAGDQRERRTSGRPAWRRQGESFRW